MAVTQKHGHRIALLSKDQHIQLKCVTSCGNQKIFCYPRLMDCREVSDDITAIALTSSWAIMMLQYKTEGVAILNRYLAAVANGDRSSFQVLYEETSPKLFALALRLTRRRDRAEEVLQDAYVRIWTRASDWDESRGTAMTWMASIVRNRAIDLLRKDVRKASFDTELARESEFTFLAPQPCEVPQDEIDQLRICIDGLERNQRRTVMLAYFEGLTHEQLALRLEAPLGTVKSWLRRGLLRLKQCLDNE